MREDYHDLWYDCSKYDTYIEWEKVEAPNVIIRGGGSLEEDPEFFTHALGAHAQKKRIFIYYWIDSLEDAEEQAQHLIGLKAKLNFWGIPVYGLMPDIEQYWSDWAAWRKYVNTTNEHLIPRLPGRVISDHGYKVCLYLERNARVTVVVYTAKWFIDDFAPEMMEWLPKYKVWLAYYLTSGDRLQITWAMLQSLQPSEEKVPDITGLLRANLILWQWTSDKFMLPGCYSVYPVRLKPIGVSCYRGLLPASEMFHYGGVYMSPTLYYPFDKGFPISQKFGVNPQWYGVSGGHNGIDWAIPVGHNLYAAQDGKVILVQESTVGYGRHVRIQSADGITIYGHMSKVLVTQGQEVKSHELIGLSGGATSDPYCGYSTGPHLHFEYRPNIKPTSGAPGTLAGAVDPMPYLVDVVVTGALFKIQCIVASLRVRSTPDLTSATNIVGGLGYNETRDVFEEKNGCYRISASEQLWVSAGTAYVKKLVVPTPLPPEVPATANTILFNIKVICDNLRIRSTADLNSTTNIIGYTANGTIHDVYEIKNGCYRIEAANQKWVSAGSSYVERVGSVPEPPVTPPPPPPVSETQPLLDWAKEIHLWAKAQGFAGKAPE